MCHTHGYIVGEHHTCPICGKDAEVYSRITGYYRPVKNWNDGKSQEYKDRRVYNIANSMSNFEGKEIVEEVVEEKCSVMEDGIYLFTTATCPNCRMAKNFLAQANVQFKEVLATDNPELTKSLNVTQAPTLVVVYNGEVKLIENVSNIRKFIETELVAA